MILLNRNTFKTAFAIVVDYYIAPNCNVEEVFHIYGIILLLVVTYSEYFYAHGCCPFY